MTPPHRGSWWSLIIFEVHQGPSIFARKVPGIAVGQLHLRYCRTVHNSGFPTAGLRFKGDKYSNIQNKGYSWEAFSKKKYWSKNPCAPQPSQSPRQVGLQGRGSLLKTLSLSRPRCSSTDRRSSRRCNPGKKMICQLGLKVLESNNNLMMRQLGFCLQKLWPLLLCWGFASKESYLTINQSIR